MAENKDVVVAKDVVEATIKSFTDLDESGDKRSMNRMARRLGKEQPALLAYAAKARAEHGDKAGEAAVFYGTLVWAVFDRNEGKCPRLTADNLKTAAEIVALAHEAVTDLESRPILERTAADLVARQPHIYAKLGELLFEDMRNALLIDRIDRGASAEALADHLMEEGDNTLLAAGDLAGLRASLEAKLGEDAVTLATAAAIFTPLQSIIEAFDAAVSGRRPGQRVGPIVRDQPKVGRNDPCPCGSGKKHKKCCGAA